jgi:hypothetical protein
MGLPPPGKPNDGSTKLSPALIKETNGAARALRWWACLRFRNGRPGPPSHRGRYNRAMSYQRTLLAGLLASLAGVLLLLSEMAFAQRSGVRSGVIGNVPAHQRIHSSAIGGGYRGAPIGNRRRSGAIRSIHPSLTGLEPLPTFVRPPSAETCRISRAPRFQLNSDAVEWTLQIVSGQTCLRGLNHGVIRIDGVKLTSPPRSGQVTVKGPGFSYQAKSNFEGQDAFILQVSGTSVRTRGTSDINVAVSVVAK